MKKIFLLFIYISGILFEANATENKCRIDSELSIKSSYLKLKVAYDSEGNQHFVPLLDEKGNPIFENGKPKYQLENPLTIICTIEGKYTIIHKKGNKDGPHIFPSDSPIMLTLPNVDPPESITPNEISIVLENLLGKMKALLQEKSCDDNNCQGNQ